MKTITIDPYVNSFGLRGWDSKEVGYFFNETNEEYLDTLKVIERWVKDEIIKELEIRTRSASHA